MSRENGIDAMTISVVEREDIDAAHLRQFADLLDFRDDPVGHVNEIRAGCLVDHQADRVFAIEMAAVVAFGRAQLDVGDVPQPQAALVDDQVTYLLD